MKYLFEHWLKIPLAALLLSACTSEFDMQGMDPKDYYAAHPVKNRLESRQQDIEARFVSGQNVIRHSEAIRGALRGISPEAVDRIDVSLAVADYRNPARRERVEKTLRSFGYGSDKIDIRSSNLVSRDQIRLHVEYVVVVAPDCPDWKRSPVTSYSNTMQGNFRCASEVNLGLMVADPHDLVHGSGSVSPDTERNSKVLQDYRAGKDFGGVTSVGGSSTNSGSMSGIASEVSGSSAGQ